MSSVTLKLSSLDLGAAKHVDGLALHIYDPANEYAKSIAEIREEKIVIVGLSAKPSSVKIRLGAYMGIRFRCCFG